MVHLTPSILASIRKALAWLWLVLRRLAARNILRHVWFFILRVFRFCAPLLSRPERAAMKGQQTNTGHGMMPKLSPSISGNVPLASGNPASQLPVTTSIPPVLGPPSTEEQETSLQYSPQNSPQPTIFGDASSNNLIQLAERGEAVQPPNHSTIELQEQATIRPSDLLVLAKPVVPEQLQRYNRKVDGNETNYIREIQPQKLDYIGPQVPGWDRIVHPEGAPYFFADRSMPVYTDTDLSTPQHCTYVEDFIRVLTNAVTRADVPGYSPTLVLKLTCEDIPTRKEQQCFYYFIDHSKRLIFWVHPVKLKDICGTARGARSEGHLRYAIETHYWFVSLIMSAPSLAAEESEVTLCLFGRHHCELFPSDATSWLTPDSHSYHQLQGMLIHANADSMLSDTAMGPFETTDLQRSRRYLCSNHLGKSDAFVLFLNFHGQFAYIRGIRRLWVDGVVDESRWKSYISKLRSDWDNYTLYSTVMFTAGISFLTELGNRDQDPRTYLIYSSIIASVSAIIVSVNLTNQIRKYDVDSVFGAADYMTSMASDRRHTWRLAVIFTLPPFFLRLAILCFVLTIGTTVISELNSVESLTMLFVWYIVLLLALNPVLWRRSPLRLRGSAA
ncbi:hypothetical protein BU15DRAFT_64540 [Melanogaster broomeanus]|nr:hypothetical protein BU15DRAFT_64540 [Melanogaster broomeanus]